MSVETSDDISVEYRWGDPIECFLLGDKGGLSTESPDVLFTPLVLVGLSCSSDTGDFESDDDRTSVLVTDWLGSIPSSLEQWISQSISDLSAGK